MSAVETAHMNFAGFVEVKDSSVVLIVAGQEVLLPFSKIQICTASKTVMISSRLSLIEQYTNANSKLATNFRYNCEQESSPLSQIQDICMLQMLVWATAFCLSKDGGSRTTGIINDTDQLKVIIEFLKGESSVTKEMVEVLVSPIQRTRTISTDKMRATNRNTLRSIQKENESDLLLSQTYEPTQIIGSATLHSLDLKGLKRYGTAALCKSQKDLAAPRRRHKVQMADYMQLTQSLNKKEKSIRVSWRDAHKSETEGRITSIEDLSSRQKWKGKHIVRARRQMTRSSY